MRTHPCMVINPAAFTTNNVDIRMPLLMSIALGLKNVALAMETNHRTAIQVSTTLPRLQPQYVPAARRAGSG